jgi:SAM-dependent methyltransferase
VIVDYGVGDRGFAGAAPKLRACRLAIGIDISAHAARESARISAEADEPYGDRWAYMVARGAGIDVVDGGADFVFAGEVIEHVDHTEEWLDEVHRVLAPGGQVLITTPNADAALYKARGEQWCVSAEHVALMNWDELRTRLEPRFEIVAAKGFNMSFHESLDADVTDPEVAKAWAANFEDRPDLSNGMVVLARRREDWTRPRHEVRHLHHDDESLRYHGAWDRATLERNLSGRLGMPGAMMATDFEGTEVIVQFWCHHFSGIAEVEVDGVVHEVDLFSPHSGFRRVVVEGLADGPHQLRVRATDRRNERSHDTQVVLHHVITGRTTA